MQEMPLLFKSDQLIDDIDPSIVTAKMDVTPNDLWTSDI
jgi:hypothetical protein